MLFNQLKSSGEKRKDSRSGLLQSGYNQEAPPLRKLAHEQFKYRGLHKAMFLIGLGQIS